jgi:2-iminobutanoate/2-iminopropanoate deaminase
MKIFLTFAQTKIMKRIVRTEKAPEPIGPYSQAVIAGNLMFVSGQIAINPADQQLETINIIRETSCVMENIGAILREAGADYSCIIKTTIFLRDMNDFKAVNDVYGNYFKENFPARETVAVSGLPKNVNVEISVTVLLSDK